MREKTPTGQHQVPSPHDWDPHGLPCQMHNSRLDLHSDRISKMESKLERHDERLNAGDVAFVEVRKDLHVVATSLKDLAGTIRWVGGLVIAAVIAAVLQQVMR